MVKANNNWAIYILYLFVFCLNGYWFLNRDGLSRNLQIEILLLSISIFVLAVFFQCLGVSSRTARHRIVRGAGYLLLFYYLHILLELLFMGGLFLLPRTGSSGGGRMNLIPFRTIRAYASFFESYPNMASVINIMGNFVIFMPMSVLLPLLFRPMRHWYIYLPFLFCLLVMTELLQNITDRGRADIDDVILNFVGAFIIYATLMVAVLIFKFFKRLKNQKIKRLKD